MHDLIVTGPQRRRLAARFEALYAGRSDVRVIEDRRRDERRRDPAARRWAEIPERRRGERRRTVAAWVFPPGRER